MYHRFNTYGIVMVSEAGSLQTLADGTHDSDYECRHARQREIGHDFDKDGRLIRLVRCEKCGLLMREYIATI